MSYDMTDQVFQKVPLPDADSSYDEGVGLCNFRGCLALIYNTGGVFPFFDVWVWTEGKAEEKGYSWFRKVSVGPLYGPQVSMSLGVGKDGRLFFRNLEGHVFFYDTRSLQMEKILHIDGANETSQVVVSYVENLLSINPTPD
ncbi:F-box/kelch-repeat protein [Tripterygium wilfordii]|uniref:F-box/kelch-repeat protein n=1 Tax=Tripterygium wilfordii TaxID=458696 RepID=A0A7J7DD29_TRIWF|nr:F-box/kelch-repeat protein [Tripterygium wilfordii]